MKFYRRWHSVQTLKIRRRCLSSLPLPLEGIRILDMSRVLAGPYASMVLGDLGAEIIKVERPYTGDDTRAWGPPFKSAESVYFMSVNRNKKSICIDFKQEEGLRIIENLVAKCDILLENYLPGKLTKIGLGYERLKTLSPGLIYCSISGYGQSGPYTHKGGYDVIAAAVGGLMHITGPEGGDPCRVGVAITDITTGLYAHGAIMAAIIQRQKTGKGKYIDCSLLSSQMAVLSHIAASYLNAGIDTGRLGTAHQSLVPYQGFKTKDGNLVVGTGNNKQFNDLCEVMKLNYLTKDSRFTDNSSRVTHRADLISILQNRFEEETTEFWLDLFDGYTFPFGPINNLEQVFDDPQVKHLEIVQEADHPRAGNFKYTGPAVAYDGKYELKTHTAAPCLGQHTKQILENVVGYSSERIEELHQRGIVF